LPDERLAPVQEGVCPLDREALWTTRQAAVEGIGFVLQDASLRPPWKKWFIAKQIFSTSKGCYPVLDIATEPSPGPRRRSGSILVILAPDVATVQDVVLSPRELSDADDNGKHSNGEKNHRADQGRVGAHSIAAPGVRTAHLFAFSQSCTRLNDILSVRARALTPSVDLFSFVAMR
jgi:hypothetical protein